jgi:hypothetical protein
MAVILPTQIFAVQLYDTKQQGVSCEGGSAHAHMRCAVACVSVRAKSILKRACDVRACGPFLCVRCAITFCTLLKEKWPEMAFLMSLLRLFLVNLYIVDAIFS